MATDSTIKTLINLVDAPGKLMVDSSSQRTSKNGTPTQSATEKEAKLIWYHLGGIPTSNHRW